MPPASAPATPAKADTEAESRMVAVVVKAAEDGSWQAAKAGLELRCRVYASSRKTL